jgi:adenine/guanine phosphoribosyltransferase-like PRPP-binding protein
MMDFLIPSRYQEFITLACRALRGYDFDAIAFSGMSGALIGPPVALALGKSMILVRKPDDDTHSCHRVEGDRNTRRYVILDDFVCSGDTKKRIVEGVKGFAPDAEFLGLLSVTYLDERELERHQGSLFPLRFAGEV